MKRMSPSRTSARFSMSSGRKRPRSSSMSLRSTMTPGPQHHSMGIWSIDLPVALEGRVVGPEGAVLLERMREFVDLHDCLLVNGLTWGIEIREWRFMMGFRQG